MEYAIKRPPRVLDVRLRLFYESEENDRGMGYAVFDLLCQQLEVILIWHERMKGEVKLQCVFLHGLPSLLRTHSTPILLYDLRFKQFKESNRVCG